MNDADLMTVALQEAMKSITEGGLPFGAALVLDGKIVSSAHNRQIQDEDFMAHAEMVCLREYMQDKNCSLQNATLVATEAPCPMCAGAAMVLGVKSVIVGENFHYSGAMDWLIKEGLDVTLLNDKACIELVKRFKAEHPELWTRFSAG